MLAGAGRWGSLWEWVAPSAPSRPDPGAAPPHPRFGLNGLVLKRRTGWWVRLVRPGDSCHAAAPARGVCRVCLGA
ncbi:hypothetical protein GCM10010103_26020 [Streptomyces paradoxus]|uniref:Uncharacterized protein n=1 Tax=Streptomyces paradoxus TaxID=66375 RepID=A0A7W9TB98_9ACTN|nr:hypothetical protein [Streptomyces paradoxus]